MKKSIEGEIFHEIEEFGNKKYEHIGFRDKENKFGEMLAEIVPEINTKKKARITIEVDDKNGK
jgi:hypothetical protein